MIRVLTKIGGPYTIQVLVFPFQAVEPLQVSGVKYNSNFVLILNIYNNFKISVSQDKKNNSKKLSLVLLISCTDKSCCCIQDFMQILISHIAMLLPLTQSQAQTRREAFVHIFNSQLQSHLWYSAKVVCVFFGMCQQSFR